MTNKNWKRAGIGACTAAALVVGAGLAFAPTANAAPAADPTNDLLGGVTTGVTGVVNGVLGTTTPTTTASSPVSITTGSGGISVGVGTVGVGVTTGNGLGVGVTTGNGSGVGVVLGSTTTGTTGTVSVENPSGLPTSTTTTPTGTSTTPTDTSSTAPTGTTTTTPTATPIMLTALSAVAKYTTVYPAKDGYRDSVTFTLNGTTSDGLQHAASGVARLTFGSSAVTSWPITATNQVITWNGLKGGKIVPGRYVLTATIGDGTTSVAGADAVDVSAKKLASASTLLTSKSVSGTHKMAAKPLAGLKTGKVTLRVISSVSHVKGKQYLIFKHAGKTLKVRILNGKHTSKAVTIPKSFTTYTISHTWKKGTVKIKSLKYKYAYKALK